MLHEDIEPPDVGHRNVLGMLAVSCLLPKETTKTICILFRTNIIPHDHLYPPGLAGAAPPGIVSNNPFQAENPSLS